MLGANKTNFIGRIKSDDSMAIEYMKFCVIDQDNRYWFNTIEECQEFIETEGKGIMNSYEEVRNQLYQDTQTKEIDKTRCPLCG